MNESASAHKRLFIGVPIDAHCQQQIDAAVQPLRADKNIRWITATNRHLTLAFLGATSDADLHKLQTAFINAYTSVIPFQFELTQLTRFPDARGHIFAAVNDASPALLQLYQRTRELLDRCQIAFEERDYRPHITLGRIHHAGQFQTQLDVSTTLSLIVNCVNLYESVASLHGREYQVRAHAALAATTPVRFS